MNYFERKTKQCFGDDARHGAGTCMIICALPLLVPGVTMTAVAFENETAFPKYGALHVFGMVLLALAILTLIIGIVLSIKFKSRVGPVESLHPMSTHRKVSVDAKMDPAFTGKSSEHANKDKVLSGALDHNFSHVNYFIQKDHSPSTAQHTTSFTQDYHTFSEIYQHSIKEHSSSNKRLVSDSSSCESSDSDDCSSGSYVITQDTLEDVSRQSLELQNDDDNNYGQSTSCSKPKDIHRPGFGNFRAAVVESLHITSNNFFQYSADDIAAELREISTNKLKNSVECQATFLSQPEANAIEGNPNKINCEVHPISTTKQISQIQTQEHSNESRQRLHGLSSDTTVISPEIPISPDYIEVPIEIPLIQSPASSKCNTPDLYASVFSVEKAENKTTEDTLQRNSPTKDSCLVTLKINHHKPLAQSRSSSGTLQLNHHRPLAQSPYATRPFSFSEADRKTVGVLNLTAGQRTSLRPISWEDGTCSAKTLVSVTSDEPMIIAPVSFLAMTTKLEMA